MRKQDNCIFCKIAAGEIPAKIVWEDDNIVAFHDLNPQADHHVLLVPKHHSESILTLAADEEGQTVIGQLLQAVPKVAEILGLTDSGFRLIINCGPGAGQTVMHLHIHMLAGRDLNESLV
ncbi:MAG: histidine triad nucleotide-binding protein [Saccharofermentanales bacterium]|jgi:histidine triad (HIT) family protein|nr:histidine triad nucleotide-binding protein [Bacillota bacterium]